MATILITTTAKFVRFKVGDDPISRFNKEVEATVRHDGSGNINVVSNLVPLVTFKKSDAISIDAIDQDPDMDIEELCDAIQELFPDAGGSALTTVNTDETLTGDGSVGNPLGEANPITSEDITNWDEAAALAASALQSENDTLETVTTRGSTTDKDIEITDATKGIIMKTGDGTRVRVSVIKDGNGDIRLNPVILIFILCASLLFNSAKAQFQNLIGRDTVNLSYRLDTMSNYLLADNFYGRLTGLVVSYSGSGLTFNVTAGYFRLRDGALRFSLGGSITLSAADATNPRWDVIGVDTTGAIFKKTGSAAASPSIPQVDDPESQLELTSVEILANEVIPSTIVQNIIYDENSGDAFTGTNTGVTVNYNNTLNVQHGSKSADVSSWTNGQTITFTKNTGTLNASDFTVLPFFIKLKSTLANTANVRISFLNGTTVVSNVITLGSTDGFSKGTTNYQNVSVSISRFTFTSTTFNKVRITLAGTGSGFYFDYMQLQSGLTVSNPETDPVANAKTVSMINGYGLIIPQSTTQTLNTNPTFTPSIDTFAVSTRAWRQKLADSLGAIIGIKLSVETDPIAIAKTVSVHPGYGILIPETQTQALSANPSHTPTADTFALETRARGLKIVDSVRSTIHATDTVNVSNVLSFGADTTGATDATSAINSAIQEATLNGKLKVYLPHGTYKITISYLKSGGTATNHKGIELLNGIELFGDGVGKTILTIGNNSTQTTSNSNIFPIINGYRVSNCKVHDLEISGNKTQQGQYTTNPYTNPAGYYADSSNRWSTSGIQFFYGDNNKVQNVYAHDCQLMGVFGMYTTNLYVGYSKLFRNGASGTTLLKACTGTFEYNICDSNASDQMRADSCNLGVVTFSYCTGSNAQADASADNWMAGIYIPGSSNVHVDHCTFFNNSAYGYDNPSTTAFLGNTLSNSLLYYNGNAGAVLNGPVKITDNIFKNNGKRVDGSHDTKSFSYDPAAIAVHDAANVIITGNHAFDTAATTAFAQTYFIRPYNTSGTYSNSIIADNYATVADTAHAFGGVGNVGTNTILNNIIKDLSDNPVLYGTAGNALIYQSNGIYKNAAPFTLTTTGSGAATFTSGTLNVPVSPTSPWQRAALSGASSSLNIVQPNTLTDTVVVGGNGAAIISSNAPRGVFNVSGKTVLGTTATNQLTVAYDATHQFTTSVASDGTTTFDNNATFVISKNIALQNFSTSVATNNFEVTSVSGLGSTTGGTLAGFTLAGAGTTQFRVGLGHGLGATLGASNAYGSVIIGNNSTVTEAGSGTHPLITSLGINALLIGNGAGATTDATSFYIAGPPTGITPTNSVTSEWIASGKMRIGTTSSDVSSILELNSTSQGFLLPRMTKTQRDAISSPATGLAIYQTDNTPGLRVYNGTNWMRYTETAD